ncbi:MAG: hypothetical protein DHS20C17_05560 [Cyclobacteriaceae bacterium]|nr:MAG: hypothetical protein DHS20C17_05560 [Cyclobacteriaceae bacterium]
MFLNKGISILFPMAILVGCGQPKDIRDRSDSSESYAHPVFDSVVISEEDASDSIFVSGQSVIFYAPSAKELAKFTIDNATREGVRKAIGEFAYYASIVSDSLKSKNIPVYFTENPHIVFDQGSYSYDIEHDNNSSLLGLILFNGQDQPVVLPGMQTHFSVLSAVNDFFSMNTAGTIPLLEYFDEVDTHTLHIYSSHSDILNQTGQKINPNYYPKFGTKLSSRADKYHMSMYAYHKFKLEDSLVAIICRVPSMYDESAIKLYIWDQQAESVLDQIELAENVWNEQWIMVKDSWISLTPDQGLFSLVQRKREARMADGLRSETDSLYQWNWTNSGFKQMPVSELLIDNYRLKDWESYQEPQSPAEITFVDEDYVWLPLETGDLTWENIIMQLPKPFKQIKEPVESTLVKGQVDTLVTISQTNVSFKFYRSPIGTLIIGGNVSTPVIKFKNGLRVGLTKKEIAPMFNRLNSSPIPDVVRIRSKQGDRTISCFFMNDSLNSIEFTNYIH